MMKRIIGILIVALAMADGLAMAGGLAVADGLAMAQGRHGSKGRQESQVQAGEPSAGGQGL